MRTGRVRRCSAGLIIPILPLSRLGENAAIKGRRLNWISRPGEGRAIHTGAATTEHCAAHDRGAALGLVCLATQA
jgi:hypothetical protein